MPIESDFQSNVIKAGKPAGLDLAPVIPFPGEVVAFGEFSPKRLTIVMHPRASRSAAPGHSDKIAISVLLSVAFNLPNSQE